jgi:hypothetical protein
MDKMEHRDLYCKLNVDDMDWACSTNGDVAITPSFGRKPSKKTLSPESVSEQYRPSDLLLSAKLVPMFVDRGCHVVSVTDPYGRILCFLDRSHYFFFQVAPQLYSGG